MYKSNFLKELIDKISNNKIIYFDTNSKINGYDFKNKVKNRCFDLIEIGLKKNDKILIFTGQGCNYWVDFLASLCLGVIVIPISESLDINLVKKIIKKLKIVPMLKRLNK